MAITPTAFGVRTLIGAEREKGNGKGRKGRTGEGRGRRNVRKGTHAPRAPARAPVAF
jgi:hypothetical protein